MTRMRELIYLIVALLFMSSSLVAKEYKLSICTIFQNDARWLKEWIEFHKIQGVEHFYLYDNNSEDNPHEVLEPYIENKEVTLIRWPFSYEYGDHNAWISIQSGAYTHCLKQFGDETKWLAIIDTDEYLYCPTGTKLPKFLTGFSEFAGLRVNWVKFGTSNVEDLSPGKLMIETLTLCSKPRDWVNHFAKSIVQPKYVEDCTDAHFVNYKEGKYEVNANKERLIYKPKVKRVSKQRTKKLLLDKIMINHYWSRTKRYFVEVKIASRQKRRNNYTPEKQIDWGDKYSKYQATGILQYVKKLRKAMGYKPLKNSKKNLPFMKIIANSESKKHE